MQGGLRRAKRRAHAFLRASETTCAHARLRGFAHPQRNRAAVTAARLSCDSVALTYSTDTPLALIGTAHFSVSSLTSLPR